MFQSTHPYRVWRYCDPSRCFQFCFNPHTHTGCDLIARRSLNKLQSFNPHTHTGCDTMDKKSFRPATVSIHTPIQGVTERTKLLCCIWAFQSTHPYRVWLKIVRVILSWVCFNPHTHTGCDTFIVNHVVLVVSFNPHTHTGCDSSLWASERVRSVSIHTPIQGVTSVSRMACCPYPEFQSTHPYRVWPSAINMVAGADSVSIHTPIQGVTGKLPTADTERLVSIHTPIQGVTRSFTFLMLPLTVSIHTPIQGVTIRSPPRQEG